MAWSRGILFWESSSLLVVLVRLLLGKAVGRTVAPSAVRYQSRVQLRFSTKTVELICNALNIKPSPPFPMLMRVFGSIRKVTYPLSDLLATFNGHTEALILYTTSLPSTAQGCHCRLFGLISQNLCVIFMLVTKTSDLGSRNKNDFS